MSALAGPLRAGLLTLLLTVTAVAAARTADPAVAAIALAAVVTGAAVLGADPAEMDPAWSLGRLVRARLAPLELLPLWAGQGVGALFGGVAGRELLERLPEQIPVERPDTVAAVALLAAAGLLGGWLIGVEAAPAALGLPTLAACAALPATVTGAVNPAVLVGVGLAGLVDWAYVLAGALAVALAAVAGAGLARLAPPATQRLSH